MWAPRRSWRICVACDLDEDLEAVHRRLDEELDYLHEAANMVRFGELWADEPRLKVPKVHPQAILAGPHFRPPMQRVSARRMTRSWRRPGRDR